MLLARITSALDRLIAGILAAGRILAIPVVLLLFLQWPLRDLVQAYSREANDLGQWLFALYVAMAVTAATRAHSHLATDVVARGYSARTRAIIARTMALIGALPWALFVLIAGRSIVISSLLAREAFADTTNPGYFLVKLALWVLAGLMLAQALVDLCRPIREGT
ncbi:MAG TPA: TRAP transporter small permease subunit [Xanthobacteraceae bacterium]|nr:TRAP transporter small permease subunit [Xanthobacteraceae bacterium]